MRPDGIDRIRTGCLEVGVTQNENALTGENPAPHMRFKNAVVMGDVTFHWYRARDARKNTEHNTEESFGSKAEEADTTWTNRVADLALIRWRAWGAVHCTMVRRSSATASPKASWTQLRNHVVVFVVVRAAVMLRCLLRPEFAAAAGCQFRRGDATTYLQAQWARFARAKPLTTFHAPLLRTRRLGRETGDARWCAARAGPLWPVCAFRRAGIRTAGWVAR